MSTNDGVRPFDSDCSPVRRISAARCFTCASSSSSSSCLSLSLTWCAPHKTAAFDDPLTAPLSAGNKNYRQGPALNIGNWIDANAARHLVYVGCTKTEYKAQHLSRLIPSTCNMCYHDHMCSNLSMLSLVRLRQSLNKNKRYFPRIHTISPVVSSSIVSPNTPTPSH